MCTSIFLQAPRGKFILAFLAEIREEGNSRNEIRTLHWSSTNMRKGWRDSGAVGESVYCRWNFLR